MPTPAYNDEGHNVIPILIDSGLGFAIGLILGLLGGGGSILTVPALVYIVGQSPQAAVTASLMIVGANSLLGAYFHRLHGVLNLRVALIFGGAGMIAAYLSAGWSKQIEPSVLMILFAALMLVVGGIMLFYKPPTDSQRQQRGWLITIVSGLGVGVLTGFLGVGGGFLIVPALVMLVGLPMRQAIGTSLIVIAMNSLAGFLGHLTGLTIDVGVIAIFVISGIVGTFAGVRLTARLHPARLRTLFAGFVIALALVLLYDNVRQVM
ncbi:sulfite exporter TauE/SafE family protein [Anaerolineae bacterium CFX9]|nr:sulfite exporter TauE/SafE family protein [Anaerolineae bacterium CFX9]